MSSTDVLYLCLGMEHVPICGRVSVSCAYQLIQFISLSCPVLDMCMMMLIILSANSLLARIQLGRDTTMLQYKYIQCGMSMRNQFFGWLKVNHHRLGEPEINYCNVTNRCIIAPGKLFLSWQHERDPLPTGHVTRALSLQPQASNEFR